MLYADLGAVEGGSWVAPVAELRPGPPLLGRHGGVVAGGAVEGLVRLVPVLAQDPLVLPSYGLHTERTGIKMSVLESNASGGGSELLTVCWYHQSSSGRGTREVRM